MATGTRSITVCPQCGCDQPDGGDECVKCGIVFAKYRPQPVRPVRTGRGASRAAAPWRRAARQWLIESDERTDAVSCAGRAGIFAVLLWWGWTLIVTPLETNYTVASFLHLINLPFHEAGHVLFMPFGRFMMFLGGSLGQILMPVICLATFLLKTRDPFGASVALWWTAENFMDVAPYINDARALDLILLGGVTGKDSDGHDWEHILGALGWLEYDHRLAHLAYDTGILLMLASFAWGGLLLFRHFRRCA